MTEPVPKANPVPTTLPVAEIMRAARTLPPLRLVSYAWGGRGGVFDAPANTQAPARAPGLRKASAPATRENGGLPLYRCHFTTRTTTRDSVSPWWYTRCVALRKSSGLAE